MKFLRTAFSLDTIFCTVFVFALLWAVSQININTDVIDPIGQALEDFQATDLVYTALRDDPKPDTNITMVNIGNLDRTGVAQLINNLNKYNPVVIGIDARFFKDKTQYYLENGLVNGDSLLEDAFSGTRNLVLATKLEDLNDATGQWNTLKRPLPRFRKHGTTAFVNVITSENDFRVSRKIVPVDFVNDTMEFFFPVKIASFFAPDKVEKYLKRNKVQRYIARKKSKIPIEGEEGLKDQETIYYRGNVNNFSGETDVFGQKNVFGAIDVQEGMEGTFDPKLVTGKILIMGYMGETLKNDKFWDEDKFYTPLNKNFAGKSFPDMYGVVVHANVVSMILNETYVEEANENLNLAINLMICILNVIIFSFIFHHIKIWWDGLSVIVTLAEVIFLIFISLVFFEYRRIQIDLGFSIIFIFLLGNFLELYFEYARPGTLFIIGKIRLLSGGKK